MFKTFSFLFSSEAVSDLANELAGDSQCQLTENRQDVVACSVVIEQSACATVLVLFAVFIRG